MEGMSNSLFLDPFQDPFAAPGAGDGSAPDRDAGSPAAAADTVPGTVVDSGAAADRADRSVAAVVPLDLVDAAGAFLDDTHLWWPREFKATDREGHVYFGQGELGEEGTDGEVHRWGALLGVSDATVELDWLGRQPPVPGSAAGSAAGVDAGRDGGVRLFLTWASSGSDGTSNDTELSVRGAGAGEWVEEWRVLLSAFARFTGGRVLESA